MGLLDFLSERDQPQAQPKNLNRLAKYLANQQDAQNRAASVMSKPGEMWKPDYERVGGHALEAPMVSPDDLIGTGIPSRIGGALAAAAKGVAAKSAAFPAVGLLGHTAWHASPYKFDKFALEKIGTGEGAQAYGHGLYLAEAKPVAQDYFDKFNDPAFRYKEQIEAAARIKEKTAQRIEKTNPKKAAQLRLDAAAVAPEGAQMYKTDIPDEALPRMLDWDKPLSEQSDVMSKLESAGLYRQPVPVSQDMIDAAKTVFNSNKTKENLNALHQLINSGRGMNGSELVKSLGSGHAEKLNAAGIPGIRYLDGGSRGAGAGSSNFVMFDPNMIRILERNGEATGAQPWKPGEWK